MKPVSVSSAYEFHPHQIVCLEHGNTCLYAEVIEVVTSRQLCWVRPVMLVVSLTSNNPSRLVLPEQVTLYDLRQGADLFWPASLFRPALDTEVIPFLVHLDNPDSNRENNPDAHKQLSCFVSEVWQAYKSAF